MNAHESNENASRSDLFAGRFQMLEKLGDGAAGDVFKVKDTVLKRKAAIKLLRFKNEERKILRFQREAKASSKLKHPGLIEVYDFGIADDGTPYLVMALVEGISLETLLKNNESLETDRALRIASLTADAMQHAHAHKVVHRDLKPSNIMIVNEGPKEQVIVLDFGLAAIIEEDGMASTMNPGSLGLAGTPNFMSPEQAVRTGVDERTDIYSLGCILFNLIAGRPPFVGESTMETIELHKNADIPKLQELVPGRKISRLLTNTIAKMLAKNPSDRFQNMAEVTSALEACRAESSSPDSPFDQGQQEKEAKTPNKRLKLVPVVVICATALLTAIALYVSAPLLVQSSDPEETRKIANEAAKTDSFPASEDITVDFNMAASVAGDTTTGEIELTPSMQLNGDAIVDRTIENILSGNPKLERIAISDAQVTDACTEAMANCKNLYTVSLEYCPKITDRALLPFRHMGKLETVGLRGSKGITDRGLETLADCPQILRLFIGNNKNLTVRGVEKLAVMPRLYHLGLGDTSVRGSDLLVLKKFRNLLYLSMDYCTLDENDAAAIAELKFLKCLSLTNSTISDKALLKLAELPILEDMKMSGTKGHSLVAVALFKQKIGQRCVVETEQPYRNVQFRIKRQ